MPKPTLENIPKDAAHEIAKYIGPGEKRFSALSLTSTEVNTLFHESFEDLALRQFLEAVVDDNPEKVKNMLEARPDLLLKKPKPGLLLSLTLRFDNYMKINNIYKQQRASCHYNVNPDQLFNDVLVIKD